ncbi:MAG: hypothetical protein QNK37_08900 [Acidobacteriota bacterium]|nr:hypothetical protein [Acidobacteriota bacterium]
METLSKDLFDDTTLSTEDRKVAGRCLNACATALAGRSTCYTNIGCTPTDISFDAAP